MTNIIRFETEYPAGKNPVDMVLLAPPGAALTKTQTWYRVDSLRPPKGLSEREQQGEAMQMLVGRWSIVEPAYEAWKSGMEIPDNGTPLGAWSAVTPGQVKILQSMNIKTVEAVRDMDGATLKACRWPNSDRLPGLADDYLKSVSSVEKDVQMAEMAERMAAMEALLEETTKPAVEPQKPKRGRPPKAATQDGEAA